MFGRFLFAIFLLFAIQPVAGSGMVVAQRDFADLVERAEQIVIGTIVGVREDNDAQGLRRTVVEVGDLTVLKGTVPGAHLALDFAGSLSGTNSRILDMPVFREGERAVLFVAGNGRAVCPLVGVWQGRFRVEKDAQSGAEIVVSDDGRQIVGRAKRHLRFAARGVTEPAITLEEFRAMIADELARPSAAR